MENSSVELPDPVEYKENLILVVETSSTDGVIKMSNPLNLPMINQNPLELLGPGADHIDSVMGNIDDYSYDDEPFRQWGADSETDVTPRCWGGK